jgi:hypothetical protein
MNKKLLILVGKKGQKGELFARLISERIANNAEVVLESFSDLFIEINQGEAKVLIRGVDIREFGLVYFRRIDHSLFPLSGTLALCLDRLEIKYFDTKFKEIGAGGDKFTSIVKLAFAGVPVPKTVFCPREKILDEKARIISSLGFPIIAKDSLAQGNSGIYLLKNERDFQKLLEMREKRLSGACIQFLFQQFVDIDKEYRLLVLGDRVAIAHKKDKRNYGSLIVTYDIPDLETEFVDIKEIPDFLKITAVKAAKALDLEIAGVDICQIKGCEGLIVFEVNRGPGFEYDETKSSEISEVANFLEKNLGKK